MDKHIWKIKLQAFWKKYEAKIALIVGLFLVASIAFEAGTLKGANFNQKPLIIEKPAVAVAINAPHGTPAQAQNLPFETKIDPTSATTPPASCAFVASKNSNKFHLATCHYAKSIKPENRVCFSSPDEAQSKGYLPDKNCIK